MDGFTACPARGEGTAQSTSTAALHFLTSRRAYVTPAPTFILRAPAAFHAGWTGHGRGSDKIVG